MFIQSSAFGLQNGRAAHVARGPWPFAVLCALVVAAGCGGSDKETAKSPADLAGAPASFDADPIALLPAGPIALGRVDFKAMLAAGASGAELAKLGDKFFPLGAEANFNSSRDLDQAYIGSYSFAGVDVLTVVRGTFDEAKIKAVADSKTPTKGGGVLVASPYANRVLYTVNNVGFTILSPKIALVGNETGMRRGLDRLRGAPPARALSGWMLDTIETKDAAFAVAADFEQIDVAAEVAKQVPLPLLTSMLAGLRTVRAVGDFRAPGVNVAATMSYREAGQAESAAKTLNKVRTMIPVLTAGSSMPIPTLQKFEATSAATDAKLKFGLDDKELAKLLQSLSAER